MKRVQLEIVLGTIFVLLSAAIIIILGFREPQRLADYVQQQRARQIEFGAGVFINNCTRCHGTQAQGITGIAPSLRDEHFFALTGLETVRENGYDVTNLSATYTLPNNAWRVSAFVDNAFDEEYIVQTFDLSGPAVFGMTEQYYGRPRWWGISVTFDWGA